MAEAKKPGAGVFDIAQPGKGQVTSATSRPVMITNRPVMTDPMVNEVPQDEPKTAPPLKPAKKMVIKPLHDDVKEAEVKESASSVEPEPVIPDTTPEPVLPSPQVADVQVKSSAPGAKQATEEKPLIEEQPQDTDKLTKERAEQIDKMIESEQYFLPINAVQERRSRQIAIIGVLFIILLALAWYNIALDAGLLPNTYNLPHTSLFTVK